jgi:hypothetical protein
VVGSWHWLVEVGSIIVALANKHGCQHFEDLILTVEDRSKVDWRRGSLGMTLSHFIHVVGSRLSRTDSLVV